MDLLPSCNPQIINIVLILFLYKYYELILILLFIFLSISKKLKNPLWESGGNLNESIRYRTMFVF